MADAERLERVFRAELANGCENRTVIGGLDRLLVQLQDDGLLPPGGALRRQAAALPAGGYRALEESDRRIWLGATIEALHQEGVAAATSPAPAPASPARPAPHTAAPAGAAARRRTTRPPAERPSASSSSKRFAIDSPVSALPGLGKSAQARFEKLGITTAGDALWFFPRRYNDFTDVRKISQLETSTLPQTVIATVEDVRDVRWGRRRAEALLRDGSGGLLKAVWFNMPYVLRALGVGERIVVSGKVRAYRGTLQMENPEYEPFDAEMASGRFVPVYPATQGLSQRTIRTAVKAAVDQLAGTAADIVPADIAKREGLDAIAAAIRTMHYPASRPEAEEARRSLALREFLAIQVAVLMRRAAWQRSSDAPELTLDDRLQPLLASLPFELTAGQRESLDDILGDIRGPYPMLRLLQGDVGSGKTVVAFAAMLAAVRSGFQAALMAPTEILAEQHYRSLMRLLGSGEISALAGVLGVEALGRPLRALLLTGSLTASQKAQIRGDAEHGGADILIGTHALLEEGVRIPRLALAVVDEQHRFGVLQRVKLRQKGTNPHLLVMTATPIPRTLALTVYGDLEVSSITELPPGRKPIGTAWVLPHERDEAYTFIREQLDAGRQAFVICPLVEESDVLDARSAEEEFERLRTGPLRKYRLELLHGRMPGRQKDEIMGRFSRHEADVLVSTSVIEVGIDVPNATVIVIEGAERFGLSQLHQFRGRVGRSAEQSYCMLFSTEEDPGPDARARLEAMVETTDGFRLAEVDLELRGEGEAWGRIQSGTNSMLRVARLTDREILLRARGLAAEILARDPRLQLAEHHRLAAAVKPFLEKATEAN